MRLSSTGTDQRCGLLTCSVARAGRLYMPSVSYHGKQSWETTYYHPHQAVEAIGIFLDGIEVVDEPDHNELRSRIACMQMQLVGQSGLRRPNPRDI